MFNVRVYKTIWNKGEKEVHDILDNQPDRNNELNPSSYFYDVALEFPPFINLELSSDSWESGNIKRVSWDVDEKRFYCYTDDEYPSLNNHATCYRTLDFDEDFLKSKCLRHGWKPLTAEE